MVKLSKNALEKISVLLSADSDRLGVRAMVRGGGCSGFQYSLEFVKESSEKDRVFSQEDVKVFVDPKSLLYLMGTEIDYVDGLDGSGFKFVNPNAKRTCGCGESFSV